MPHTLEGIEIGPDGRRSGQAWTDMTSRFSSGERVEVTESEYWYFLEVLPPLRMSGSSFLFAEGDMTPIRFERQGERYWAEQLHGQA